MRISFQHFILFSVIYNSPTFFEITTAIDKEDNSTYIITGTSLRKNFIYFSVYKVYCKIALDLFAYIMMIVLNFFIITKIVHSSQFRKKITKNEGEATTTDAESFLNDKSKSMMSRNMSKAEIYQREIKTRRELGKGFEFTFINRC